MKGPLTSYVDSLDEAIIAEIQRVKDEGNKSYPLRPSSAGKCTRELAYELMEYEGKAEYDKKLMTPEAYRLLNLGHSVEYALLRDMGLIKDLDIKYKQQVVDFFKIGDRIIEGSLDSVLISKDHRGVMDVKSKGDKYSKAYKSKWDEDTDDFSNMKSLTQFGENAFYAEDLTKFLNEIKSEPYLVANFLQLNLYACSSFLKDRGIDHGSIIQYCKNDSRLREIRFKPDERMVEKIKKKFELVTDAVAKGDPKLAPRDYALGSMKCGFCPYQQDCHGTPDALKEWFKTFPKKEWPTDFFRLKNKIGLSEAYKELKWASEASSAREQAEQEIIKIMQANNVTKIKFDDGKIYELKFLKSPYPRIELREGKL